MLRSLTGMVTLKINSADVPGFLTALNKASVAVFETEYCDELTVRLTIYRRDYRQVRQIARRRGETLEILGRNGFYWTAKKLLKRPVLTVGLAIVLAVSAYLPGRILFICVEGNDTVPTNLILEKAEQSGICFGADRREVRSEKVKNSLLEAIDQLQWAGVNTRGCVATISIRERTDADEQLPSYGVSSIVASRDGVIESYTVTRGNALCKVGQAVRAGEVLVSGYTDCGITIQATRAEGEIFARTKRNMTVFAPTNSIKRGEITGVHKKYGLLIGKKRINFYKDSGISDVSCDKMYSEYYLTLPAGFQLPVALVVETWYTYDTEVISVSEETAQDAMSQFARKYMQTQMLSGEIISGSEVLQQKQDVYILQGEYMCLEMIGRVRSEEIIGSNGKSD